MKLFLETFRLLRLVTVIVLFTGCRQNPEAEGRAIAAQINAKSLFEVTMQNQLQAYAHIPGGARVALEQYAAMCTKYGFAPDTSFQEALKQGYPELETIIQHETLSENANPTAKNETLYLITFKVNATSPQGHKYLLILQFTAFSCAEGVAVLKVGGCDELDGKRTILNDTESILIRIASVRKGIDGLMKHFDDTLEKK